MAGDWIKMRTDLYRDPKVIVMADLLMERKSELARFVNQNLQRDMTVTRNVTRNAVVGGLVSVWGVLRHQGYADGLDLRINGVTLSVIDDIADIPGFGQAMEDAGWVEQDDVGFFLPRFYEEYNTDPADEEKAKNRERQRRFRERKRKENESEKRNVTRNAKRNAREEKSREEKSREEETPLNPPSGGKPKAKPKQKIAVTTEQLTFPPSLDTPECRKAAEEWIEYKRSRGQPYKNPNHLNKLLEEFSRDGPQAFREAVNWSIARNYQGIFKPGGAHGKRSGPQNGPGQRYDPDAEPSTF